MEVGKALRDNLKEMGLEYKQKNKDTSVVKLLDKTIGAFSSVLKTVDKFLKEKGVDVGGLYGEGKNKAKSAFEALKKNKDGEDVGLLRGIADKTRDISSSIRNKFKDSGEGDSGAPPGGSFYDRLTSKLDYLNEDEEDEEEETPSRSRKKRFGVVRTPLGLLASLYTKLIPSLSGNIASLTSGLVRGTSSIIYEQTLGRLGLPNPFSKRKKGQPPSLMSRLVSGIVGVVSTGLGFLNPFRKRKGKDGEKKPSLFGSLVRGITGTVSAGLGYLNPFKRKKDSSSPETSEPGMLGKIGGGLKSAWSDVSSGFWESYNKKPMSSDEVGDAEVEDQGGWFEKARLRSRKRKEEIEAEKKDALERNKKKGKKGGWLSSILSGIGAIGGVFKTVLWGATKWLGKGIGRAIWWGGKQMIRGLGTTLGKVFGNLIPKLGGLLKSGLSTLASGAKGLLGKGLSTALSVGKAALPWVGRAAGFAARAAGMVLTGPVGWGIAIGTAIYGGYKLYKYLTRNNIDEDIFGKMMLLRFQTYGYSSTNKDHYSKLIDLEQLMKDNLVWNSQDNKLSITKPNEEQIEKIFDLFDAESDDKERRTVVNNWFAKRFIPAFHGFMSSLYAINKDIYVDELDKLSPPNIRDMFVAYKIPTKALEFKIIPFFDKPETDVTTEMVEDTIKSIIEENRLKISKSDMTPEERMRYEVTKKKVEEFYNKTPGKMPSFKDMANELRNGGVAKAYNGQLTGQSAAPGVTASNGPVGIMAMPAATNNSVLANADAEKEPAKTPMMMMTNNSGNTTRVTVAAGPLTRGTPGDLTGITTNLKPEEINNLDPILLNLLKGMAKEYNTLTGKSININEAWRSRQKQEALYKQNPNKAAPPGSSLHEFGLAFDINQETTRELEKLGLLRKYGFTVPVGGEPWHIEPIGVSLNRQAVKHDIELRKNALIESPGRGGGGYGLMPNSRPMTRDDKLQLAIYEGKVTVNEADAAMVVGANGLPKSTTPVTSTQSSSNTGTSSTSSGGTGLTVASATATAVDTAVGSKPQEARALDYSQLMSEANKPIGMSTASITGMGKNISPANISNLSPVEAIRQASQMTGVSEETLMTFGKLESSLRGDVGAATSGATGLFQFTPGTWKDMLRLYGAKYGYGPDTPRTDTLASAIFAAEYAKSNLKRVAGYEALGITEEQALYLTHHFGPSGGARIIQGYKRNPNAPMSTLVSSDAYAANQAALGGLNASQYLDSLRSKFQIAKNTDASAYKGSGATAIASNTTVAPTKPTQPSVPASVTPQRDNDSGFMRASYGAPTVASMYEDISVKPKTTAPQPAAPQPQPVKTDNSVEGLLGEQLTTLKQIATIMDNIDGKLDFDKVIKALNNMSNMVPTPNTGRFTGVNVNRRIEA